MFTYQIAHFLQMNINLKDFLYNCCTIIIEVYCYFMAAESNLDIHHHAYLDI